MECVSIHIIVFVYLLPVIYILLSEMKHKRLRYNLKVAIKDKDKFKLQYSINEFKTEKVEDVDMDLEKAERLLKELTSRDSKA